ncbi:MAG: bifunctional glutamate N-acetyltransferase/amino-acid acetyltransferase ArgJ [Acidimicrobiia bacterium]|nr:bifunctional glutamate N-acetyltransferase/amino-acid acetyltransferase ArgJ [Acidimicrobiia bacterium]
MSAITAPKGFVAGGVHAGLKTSGKLDLSIVATADGKPVSAAAVFTSNKLAAAPVQVSRAHLAASGGRAAGIIVNSGNANAATGVAGYEHAEKMCELTADGLGCTADEILVCSTGLIGIPMPFDVVEAGIPRVVASRSTMGGTDAATGIMTTDSVRKEVIHQGSTFKIGAMAKGAGMLQPNMATMLAFLTTDAEVEPSDLHAMLRQAVDKSFNRLTVDGAQSTNDTVIALASGAAGPADPAELQEALDSVCYDLALQMADDAEGSTKTVIIRIQGAVDDLQALHAARAVANNQLAKCSWYGKNAYWGRVASEVGASGIAFDPDLYSVSYGEAVTAAAGVAVAYDEAKMAEYFENRRIHITVDLGLGDGVGEIVTTDLSHAYVDENMGKS